MCEKSRNRHISATVGPIGMIFALVIYVDHPNHNGQLKLQTFKNPIRWTAAILKKW